MCQHEPGEVRRADGRVGAGVGREEDQTYEPDVLGHVDGVTRGWVPSSTRRGL